MIDKRLMRRVRSIVFDPQRVVEVLKLIVDIPPDALVRGVYYDEMTQRLHINIISEEFEVISEGAEPYVVILPFKSGMIQMGGLFD